MNGSTRRSSLPRFRAACPGEELKDAGSGVGQAVMILIQHFFGAWDGVARGNNDPMISVKFIPTLLQK